MRQAGLILVAVACIATLASQVELPSSGIDPSWQLGLHLAREDGLVAGDDIVFNYGPWGYLQFPLTLVRSQWLAAVAYRISVHVALFAAVALWMRRHLAGWKALVAVVPLVLFVPQVEYQWPLALVLWLRLACGTGVERPWAGLAVGLVGATALLIKFSMGLATLFVIGGGLAAAWIAGRHRFAGALAAGYVGGYLLWGSIALESPARLAGFLADSWEISSGYALGLERQGPLWQPALALLAFGLLCFGILRDRRNQPVGLFALLLPLTGLLVVTFKHAFVRHETHAPLAFSVGAVALTWIFLEAAERGPLGSRLLRGCGPLLIFAGALLVLPPRHLASLPRVVPERIGQFVEALRETSHPGYRERLRATLRHQLPFPQAMLELVGSRTVDVLTLEVALVEAWQLNWQPRRVLQSYAVVTSKLDDLDAAFFASERAPERLIVDMQGVDTRHPFMDAPRSWREILSRYEPLARNARWSVLGLRSTARRARETPLVQAPLEMNRPALIPRPSSGQLELAVRLEPSLLGRIVSIPWKLPEIRLGLLGPDTQPRRILAPTAHRPFPVTASWADSPEQLWELFGAEPAAPPEALVLITRGAWAWKPAELEFSRLEWD